MEPAPAVRPIVVGYDHSDASSAALKWAGHLAESSGAPIRVVHASETTHHALDVPYELIDSVSGHEFAERIAREGARRLSTAHPCLEVEAIGSIDSARVALDESSTSASVIVIGSHGRGRVGSVLLGSTAYALNGHARCSVIVVRDALAPLPGPGRPIVVGSDGSVGAIHAVHAATDLAARCLAPLVIVSSWTSPPSDPWGRPPTGYLSVTAALKVRKGKAREANRESVARVRSALQTVEVEGLVVESRPEDAIMHVAPDAAMLVLGSRGHTKVMGALLGSTARAVLHHSTKPVMVAH